MVKEYLLLPPECRGITPIMERLLFRRTRVGGEFRSQNVSAPRGIYGTTARRYGVDELSKCTDDQSGARI